MLKRFYPHAYVDSVFAIDYCKLKKMGCKGLVFDIDNTLVHHGEDATPQVEALFRTLHAMELKTLLLSDNNTERIARFVQNIDTLYIPDANKPDTAGYRRATELLGLEKQQVVVIGDQVFTDIYGANRSGIASILVKYMRYPSETRIGKKRTLEKLVLWFYRRNRRCFNRMGDILKEETEYAAEQTEAVL